jgi:hypothetical protein
MRVELPEAHLKMQVELAAEEHPVMQVEFRAQAQFAAAPQGQA